jgi:hypothetical protein
VKGERAKAGGDHLRQQNDYEYHRKVNGGKGQVIDG